MKQHDEFWTRVNSLLDARADPLEDAQVQRELERSPELLAELLSLQDAVQALNTSRSPLRSAVRRTAVGSVAVAAAAAAVLLWIWGRSTPATPPVDPPLALAPRFAPIPRDALLELRATFTRTSPNGEQIEHVDLLESRSSVERREPGPHGWATLIALAHHQPRSRQP